MKPSTAAVLGLLRRAGRTGVTPLLAQQEVGTMRLAARVADLRAEGYDVRTERITVPTRNAPATVARYVLVEGPEQLVVGL